MKSDFLLVCQANVVDYTRYRFWVVPDYGVKNAVLFQVRNWQAHVHVTEMMIYACLFIFIPCQLFKL